MAGFIAGKYCSRSCGESKEHGASRQTDRCARNNPACPRRRDPRWMQGARGSCGCPIPTGVQGPAGRGLEKPGLVEGVLAHGKGWNETVFNVPCNKKNIVRFCVSTILGSVILELHDPALSAPPR